MLGFLTRTAAFFGAVMLALYYLATPPWPGFVYSIPSEGAYMIINKTFIELCALVVTLFFSTGHLVGLDRLVRLARNRGSARNPTLDAHSESHGGRTMSDEIRNGDDEVFDDANAPDDGQPVGRRPLKPIEEPAAEESRKQPKAGSDQRRSGGMGRRDVLKALATVPVLGALGYTALQRRGLAREERERLLAELGIEDEGAAVFSELETRTHPDTLRIGIVGFGGEGESLIRSLGFAHPDWIQARREARIENPRDTLARGVARAGEPQPRAHGGVRRVRRAGRAGDRRVDAADAAGWRHAPAASRPSGTATTRSCWRAPTSTPSSSRHRTTGTRGSRSPPPQAGKHVYCEKCMTRTEEEVWPMADAVKSSGIVFQLGHQNRQMESHEKAREVIEKGILGPITLVETTTNRNDPWGAWVWDIHEEGNPRTIDWELFQEAAANKVPFSLERFFRWRCWYDYGTGLAGDLLSHEYDAINQILDGGNSSLGRRLRAASTSSRTAATCPTCSRPSSSIPDRDLTLVYSATLANGRDRGMVFMGHDATMEVGSRLKVTADGSVDPLRGACSRRGSSNTGSPDAHVPSGFKGVDAVTTADARSTSRAAGCCSPTGAASASARTTCTCASGWTRSATAARPSCNIDRGIRGGDHLPHGHQVVPARAGRCSGIRCSARSSERRMSQASSCRRRHGRQRARSRKVQLGAMMFLQYAIWGAWAPVLSSYLLGDLGFSGGQVGWIYALAAAGDDHRAVHRRPGRRPVLRHRAGDRLPVVHRRHRAHGRGAHGRLRRDVRC